MLPQFVKSRAFIQYTALSAANIWITFAVIVSSRLAQLHWGETLPGAVLPTATLVAFKVAYVWPIAALVLALTGVALAFWRSVSQWQLDVGFIVLALTELVLLGFHVLCIMMPTIAINYRVGG